MLLQRCRAGDRNAYEGLVARHERRVYHLCLRLLGNADEAVDSAQDVFVEAWRALSTFRERSTFGTWLHSIAVHVCRQAIRRKRRIRARGEYSLDDAGALDARGRTLAEILPDGAAQPDRSAEASEAGTLVRAALAVLPIAFREALVLRELEGMSYDEIAATLRVRMWTVKSRIARAKIVLRTVVRRMPAFGGKT